MDNRDRAERKAGQLLAEIERSKPGPRAGQKDKLHAEAYLKPTNKRSEKRISPIHRQNAGSSSLHSRRSKPGPRAKKDRVDGAP